MQAAAFGPGNAVSSRGTGDWGAEGEEESAWGIPKYHYHDLTEGGDARQYR